MENYIKEIVQLQEDLMFEFKRAYPEVYDYDLLLDFPKKGILHIKKQKWIFNKHGCGLNFTRKNPLPEVIVDIHNYLSEPKVIDKWRVELYLNSINISYSDNDIEECLNEMVSTNYLEMLSSQKYKLIKY